MSKQTDQATHELRKKIREIARQRNIDPDLAEAALAPEQTVPQELLDILRLTADTLVRHVPGKQTPGK